MVCDDSETISVFKYHEVTVTEQLTVEGLQSPHDIASCKLNRCLYIVDGKSNCVWKISDTQLKPTTSKRITPQKVMIISKPYVFTVAKDGNILKIQQQNHVQIHSPEGNLILSFQIPIPSNVETMQIVQKANGNFLSSYKKLTHSQTGRAWNWYVSEFDEGGTSVMNSGAQAGHLRDSRYLAVITEGDDDLFVITADCDNSTVLMLDDNLKLCKHNILLNNQHDDILYPNRIIYIAKTKELIVGQHNGLIKVYKVDVMSHKTYGRQDSNVLHKMERVNHRF